MFSTLHAPAPGGHRVWLPRLAGYGGALLLLGLLGVGGHAARAANTEISKEYQLKAAFLYNFTKFIEWPAGSFADDTSPILIGVMGRNPFGDELENIVKDRTVNGRAIKVRLIRAADEVPAVQLLFVPAGEEASLARTAWKDTAVVAVGESAAFTALGGTITFVEEADKLRFEIDIAAAERGHVKISAQLQKLATVVRHRL